QHLIPPKPCGALDPVWPLTKRLSRTTPCGALMGYCPRLPAPQRRIGITYPCQSSGRARRVRANQQWPAGKRRALNRETPMTKPTKDKTTSRRRFLKVAAAGAAATVAAPNIASAQGPVSMRWQSTGPAKHIFPEYALDYAKKVNDMTGGDLKIEVLPAGAVVPAFGLLDAVSKGTLDGGH